MKACDDALALCEHFELGEIDPENGPTVPAELALSFASALKGLGYDYFVTCVAVHLPAEPGAEPEEGAEPEPGLPDRYRVAYHLRRIPDGHFAFLLEVETSCPSLAGVWRGADWHEREQYDLVGVVFDGHPDPRRLMMPEDWEGHPLRKEYAIETGHFPWR